MEDRRKINRQHKQKDKNRNAKPTAPIVSKPTQKLAPAEVHQKQLDDSEGGIIDSSNLFQPQFSKRTVTSNWDKYELDTLNTEENEQLNAADFEQLLLAPLSVGSHFVFSNEKNWNQDAIDTTLFGNPHFRFNLAEFEQQMQTIPFYVRHGYDSSWFSTAEIKYMDDKAKFSKPESVMENAQPKDMSVKMRSVLKGRTTTNAIRTNDGVEIKGDVPDIEDELDALLNISLGPTKSVPMPKAAPFKTVSPKQTHSNDIQKWLDDMLDE